MTTLQVLPLQLSDFDTIISHAHTYPPSQDLVGPPTPLCYPVTTPSEALTRLTFHFAKQRARFLADPSVRYMKVVSTSLPTPASPAQEEIISIARWHFYPMGYSFARDIPWELHPDTSPPPSSTPPTFNIRLHNHILRTRDAARASWIPADEPCWILMHMVTHPAHRGKGAAGMLVRWGIEQAEKDGVPAYLEAGVLGRPVYERFGFEQVGALLEVRLEEGGGEGAFVMAKMRYVPGRGGGKGEKGERELGDNGRAGLVAQTV